MRKIVLAIALPIFLFGCGGEDRKITPDIIKNPVSGSSEKETEVPALTFTEQRFEFGTISQGERIEHTFEFTNTGTAPLVINAIEGSCGCTVVDNWTKDPIQPGEKGSFLAQFNSEGKEGQQNIRITVAANTIPSSSIAVMAGNVVKPKGK
ncbi:DUF1573 domain-containing protein [Luteibaculum oceani]|uniref:DUF1573 domain-containing protein n=1 Tax=Luteibaculum oceani TaxID=1294296 RepID=A0A5C6VE30_9FLAO|nr:DUF1573 domain-containing protein [Luteibaculum oceani]TXC82015.1 DUF1573 domain-containing protein [Luteibaculum oceani]